MRAERNAQQLKESLETRETLVATLLGWLVDAQCCSLIGVSNMGKSSVFRALYSVGRERYPSSLFVYVDCNRMLSMSDRGFYELILRCIQQELASLEGRGTSAPMLADAYEKVTNGQTDFQVSLGFSEGITNLIERQPKGVVLLLDEFDEPLRKLDGRVLLNLRALYDRYPGRLAYALATNHPLREIRRDAHADEFCELFVHHTCYLAPLTTEETRAMALQLAERAKVTFGERDIQFISIKTGGHPGLIEAVCTVLGEVTGEPTRDAMQDWIIHREVSERLRLHNAVQNECYKLWADLAPHEQEALVEFVSRQEVHSLSALRSLQDKYLLRVTAEQVEVFGQLFEEYVGRQSIVRRGGRRGLRLDVESGEVWVDGKPVPPLTRLEFRLLMLLYGNLGKICDKYQVVQAVWGEEYLESVDDARIEKLVSRLRQKLEPDAANPRYLITIRGRGYRLVDE